MARYAPSPHQSPKGPRPIHATPSPGSSPRLQPYPSEMSIASLGSRAADLNAPLMPMPQPSRPMQQVPYSQSQPHSSSYLSGPPQQFPEYKSYHPSTSSPSQAPHLQPQYHPQQPAYAPQYPQHPSHRPSLPYSGPASPHMRPGMFVATAGTEEQRRLYYQDQTNPMPRHKTLKRVKLTNGNLILDCQVPRRVLQNAEFQTGEEFTHLRYTAATCDPNDFVAQKYTLRQKLYGRHTEIFVVMTMYNENDELFIKTMSAVMKNIAHLCSRTKSRTWGEEGWKKVTICIVADGRKKCHPRVLTVLGAMGVYQDGIAKNTVNGKETTAHIYEYTTQVMVDPKLGIRGKDRGVVPVQVLFCLKEQNKKKLNSHRWFFNAFGAVLQPNVCVLLDVGTRPTTTSIYHLWKAFDRDPMIAGACGEIAAELGSHWENLRNPLVATQNFEYKMSNILDKPLESVMGYISVLPGAFSAYRYAALQDYEPNKGPLSSYFKGETMHGAGAGVFEANMYLAEDRILCFELVAKPHCSWLLKYVKAAKAETDVPDAVPELISQRRRWLNGSFFAATYALVNWTNIWKTSHSFTRKILLQFEFLYNTVSILFSWFSLGNFYLTFYFLTISASDVNGPFGSDLTTVQWVIEIMRNVYVFSLIVTFICALGNRPQGSKFVYTLCMVLFAGIMVLMLYMAVFTVVKNIQVVAQHTADLSGFLKAVAQNHAFRDIIISLGSTYGVYFLASVMHMDPWHMVTSFVQYLLLLPSFVNILMVYSFCNTHDVSWGTKGDNAPKADLGAAVAKPGVEGGEVELELPMETEGLDEMYDRLLREIVVRPEEKHQSRDAKTKQDDYYKMFRTRLVLLWVFSNCVLILVVMNTVTGDTTSTKSSSIGYLSFIFWSVAVLSFIRFLGSTAYLLLQSIFG